jgi:hypothetical protein
MHERIGEVCRVAALMVTALIVSANANATFGTCDDPYDFVLFRFELTQAARNERRDFVGTFEIENVRFGKEIVLEGTAKRGVFEVDYPQIHLEFMDLTGEWRSLMYLPGTFLGPPDKLRLPAGGKASFTTQLPTKEQLELGGSKFRVLLSAGADICIQSEPFSVIQKRGPIEGFKHEERSNKALQRTRSKQRASER